MLFKIVESISKIFTKSISLESDTDSVEITVPEERTLLIDSNIVSGNLLKFNDLDIVNNIYVGNDAFISGTLTAGEGYISGGLVLGNYLQLLPVDIVNIPTNTTASYIYTSGSTNDLYFTQYGGGVDNVIRLRWLESLLTTGVMHGGILSSVNGTTTFSITDGSGLVIRYNADTDQEPYPEVKYVNWNNYVSQSLIYSGSAQITYIAINASGSIIQSPTSFTLNDFDDKIILGRILHQSGAVSTGVSTAPRTAYGASKKSSDFIKALGPLKIAGHVLAASGSTLGLIKSSGTAFVEGRNYTFSPDDPNVTLPAEDSAVVNSKIYRQRVSGSITITDTGVGGAGYTVIDPTKYNNNGTLATVTANKWTLQRVYWFPRSANKALFVYYGTAIYNSQSEAVSALLTEEFVEGENTVGSAIFVATIIVRGAAANLADIGDAKIVQAGIFGSGGAAGGGGGAAVIPGDGDMSVQFNDGGSVFGGSPNFTFNKTTDLLSLTSQAGMSFAANDIGDIINSYNTSAGSANQFFINHNLGNVELGNARGNTIVTSGNLGIGINPTQKLHVAGETLINGGGSLRLQPVTPGNDGILKFMEPAGTLRTSVYYAGTDLLRIADTTTDRLVIDSTGDVGIGTNSPQRPLDVVGTINDLGASIGNIITIGSWTGLHFGYRTDSNEYRKSGIVFERTDAAARGKIHILNDSAADAGNAVLADAKLTIDVSGNVGIGTTVPNFKLAVTGTLGVSGDTTIANGNLIFGTAGKGVDFSINPSATSGTTSSELLSDYEEGTWSPTLSGSITSGSFTYTIRNGIYTKIGNVVNINCYIVITSTATALTGSVRIGALPFLVRASTTAAAAVGYYNLNTTINSLSWVAQPSTSYINFYRNTAPGSSLQTAFTASAANELGTTPFVALQGFYYTNE